MTKVTVSFILIFFTAVIPLQSAGASDLGPRGQQLIDRILASHDLDLDGRISEDEILQVRRQRFEQADRNADGRIDSEEILALGELAMNSRDRGGRRAEGQYLSRLDADADGAISLDEFESAGNPVLERADADGDGLITRSELATALRDRRGQRRRR